MNTVMWLLSSAALLTWIFGITVKRFFATNAKYFGILLVVHLALSFTAIMLKKQGVVVLHKGDNPLLREVVTLFLKSYMALVMIIMTGFMIALVQRGAQQMTRFHTTSNAANLHRHPLKFYLRHESTIVQTYRLFFTFGGVYILWALWFKKDF
ncbi:hypothetical protein [Enterobacter sp. Bisph1]|uniref:hypothetical protein n=1 Tax=Enterobacter sp. Bisph1 TaxID=1274399 RepID=UPI000B311E63|nr:hypothetical protein [Enterobacter sp. Bisph1]